MQDFSINSSIPEPERGNGIFLHSGFGKGSLAILQSVPAFVP